jgi:hypothetical protein
VCVSNYSDLLTLQNPVVRELFRPFVSTVQNGKSNRLESCGRTEAMFCCRCGTTLPDVIDFCADCGNYVPHARNTHRPLPNTNQTRAQRVRELFEGREAIYQEKGALHVKVSNIQMNVHAPWICADVMEIPTAGFPTGGYHSWCLVLTCPIPEIEKQLSSAKVGTRDYEIRHYAAPCYLFPSSDAR